MKKLFFFVFLVLVILISLKVNASHVSLSSCSYSTTLDFDPSATSPLFRASGITNAHIEEGQPGNPSPTYPYFIQCRGGNIRSAFYVPPSSRVSEAGDVAWLYSQTNSPVLTQYGDYYGVATLIENNPSPTESISCGTLNGASGGNGNAECTAAGWDVCVYSASDTTNAHVGACFGAGISYSVKMCCRVGAPPAGSAVLQYIQISPKDAFKNPGQSVTYKTRAYFKDGTSLDVSTLASYSSSDNSKVSCLNNVCTANLLGTSTITSSYGGFSDTSLFTVVDIARRSHIDLLPDFATINVGDVQAFDFILYYSNESFSYYRNSNIVAGLSSSDISVATIVLNSSSGKNQNAQANAAGITNISALAGLSTDTSPLSVTDIACKLISANFTWTDPSDGTTYILDGTVQSDGTPVDMTLNTVNCDGRSVNFQLYQKDCSSNTFQQVPPPNNGILITSNKAVVPINLIWSATTCPENLAQYRFNADVVQTAGIVGPDNLDSNIIYVNQTVYTPGDPPCTSCYPPSSSTCSGSCYGASSIPNGYSCIPAPGYCNVPAGSSCCFGLQSGVVGDVKIIITRESECKDVGRNDGTGQVTELWRRVNVSDNKILESRETQKDCLIAKPANVPFFSLVNVFVVLVLICTYYLFTVKRKVRNK